MIDRAICDTIEVQYSLRLSFALRNFNCCKINRGWCQIRNLLLVWVPGTSTSQAHTGAHASVQETERKLWQYLCSNKWVLRNLAISMWNHKHTDGDICMKWEQGGADDILLCPCGGESCCLFVPLHKSLSNLCRTHYHGETHHESSPW